MDATTRYSFVFGQRDGERVCLVIEALSPDAPRIGHGEPICVEMHPGDSNPVALVDEPR